MVKGEDGLILRMGRHPLSGPGPPISQLRSTPGSRLTACSQWAEMIHALGPPGRAGGKATYWPPCLPLTWADGSPAKETVN